MDVGDEERWIHIQGHAQVGEHSAPTGVIQSIAALVAARPIIASWSSVSIANPTTWLCFLLTESLVGYVTVQYPTDWLTGSTENAKRLQPSKQFAAGRRLSDVSGINYGRLHNVGPDKLWYPAEAIELTLNSGQPWQLPLGDQFGPSDSERLDIFLTALRAGIGF